MTSNIDVTFFHETRSCAQHVPRLANFSTCIRYPRGYRVPKPEDVTVAVTTMKQFYAGNGAAIILSLRMGEGQAS